MNESFQKNMDELISGLGGRVPSLLLHSCCGPCSSYVLEYLSKHFNITVYFYNPNVQPEEEYYHRLKAQKDLLEKAEYTHPVSLLEGDYDPQIFFDAVKGLESEREGGSRCTQCFKLRLEKTACAAAERGFDYFATTLTVSPHKNSVIINSVGAETGILYKGSKYLASDFKKREGFKRSIELSKQYELYRQDYCGCIFSKNQRFGTSEAENE